MNEKFNPNGKGLLENEVLENSKGNIKKLVDFFIENISTIYSWVKTNVELLLISERDLNMMIKSLQFWNYDNFEEAKVKRGISIDSVKRIINWVIIQELANYSFDDARALIAHFEIDEKDIDELKTVAIRVRKNQWGNEYKRIEEFVL